VYIPPIEMKSKQSCSFCWELSNSMWHATCTQGNRDNSWLLMVGSQIANSTPGHSFGRNLCFRCPNGSCKPISDIYIPRTFQWYKEHLNPMGFDPCNRSLKIWKSIGSPSRVQLPKLEFLGSVRVHSLTLFCTPESMRCDSWASLLARTLATLCFGHNPKAKVATLKVCFLTLNRKKGDENSKIVVNAIIGQHHH
jgi:hypothetical protein